MAIDKKKDFQEAEHHVVAHDVQMKREYAELAIEKMDLEQLRKHAVTLQQKNLTLEEQIRLKREERSSQEFASAVQKSIDELQLEFSRTTNPVSDFAVKNVEFEANVVMDFDEVGGIKLRFPGVEEEIDRDRLSRIKLDIVPVPKQSGVGSYDRKHFDSSTDIEAIDGIGNVYREKLNDKRIYTVGELAAVGSKARAKAELSAMLGIEREELAGWLGQAQLMTLKNMEGVHARALYEAGINDLATLAETDPAVIADRVNALLRKRRSKATPISEEQATAWRDGARRFAGKDDEREPEKSHAD